MDNCVVMPKGSQKNKKVSARFKQHWFKATLEFVKNDSRLTFKYPKISNAQAEFIYTLLRPDTERNVTDPTCQYSALHEAFKIFGLKYDFQLSFTGGQHDKYLLLKKVPKSNRKTDDGAHRQCNPTFSQSVQDLTEENPKDIDQLSHLYMVQTLKVLLEFLYDNERATFEINNVKPLESLFLQCALTASRPLFDDHMKILSIIRMAEPSQKFYLKVDVGKIVNKKERLRNVTFTKIPKFDCKPTEAIGQPEKSTKSPKSKNKKDSVVRPLPSTSRNYRKFVNDIECVASAKTSEDNVASPKNSGQISIDKSVKLPVFNSNCENWKAFKSKTYMKRSVEKNSKFEKDVDSCFANMETLHLNPIVIDKSVKTYNSCQNTERECRLSKSKSWPDLRMKLTDYKTQTYNDQLRNITPLLINTLPKFDENYDNRCVSMSGLDRMNTDQLKITVSVQSDLNLNSNVQNFPSNGSNDLYRNLYLKTKDPRSLFTYKSEENIDDRQRSRTWYQNENSFLSNDMKCMSEPKLDQSMDNSERMSKIDKMVEKLQTSRSLSKSKCKPRSGVIDTRKAKLIEALSVPVHIEKSARMMKIMGYEGGPLGVRGEGITEPIMPSLNLVNGAGLGYSQTVQINPVPKEPTTLAPVPKTKPKKKKKKVKKQSYSQIAKEVPKIVDQSAEFRMEVLRTLSDLITTDEKTITFKYTLNDKDVYFFNILLHNLHCATLYTIEFNSVEEELLKEFESKCPKYMEVDIAGSISNCFTKIHLVNATKKFLRLPHYDVIDITAERLHNCKLKKSIKGQKALRVLILSDILEFLKANRAYRQLNIGKLMDSERYIDDLVTTINFRSYLYQSKTQIEQFMLEEVLSVVFETGFVMRYTLTGKPKKCLIYLLKKTPVNKNYSDYIIPPGKKEKHNFINLNNIKELDCKDTIVINNSNKQNVIINNNIKNNSIDNKNILDDEDYLLMSHDSDVMLIEEVNDIILISDDDDDSRNDGNENHKVGREVESVLGVGVTPTEAIKLEVEDSTLKTVNSKVEIDKVTVLTPTEPNRTENYTTERYSKNYRTLITPFVDVKPTKAVQLENSAEHNPLKVAKRKVEIEKVTVPIENVNTIDVVTSESTINSIEQQSNADNVDFISRTLQDRNDKIGNKEISIENVNLDTQVHKIPENIRNSIENLNSGIVNIAKPNSIENVFANNGNIENVNNIVNETSIEVVKPSENTKISMERKLNTDINVDKAGTETLSLEKASNVEAKANNNIKIISIEYLVSKERKLDENAIENYVFDINSSEYFANETLLNLHVEESDVFDEKEKKADYNTKNNQLILENANNIDFKIEKTDTSEKHDIENDLDNIVFDSEETDFDRPPRKRSRVNEDISKEIHYRNVTTISIVSIDEEEYLNKESVLKIQTIISKAIDNGTELPLLNCHGVKDGGLVYTCHDEKSLLFLKKCFVDSHYNIVDCVTINEFVKLSVRINSLLENVQKWFQMLELYNKGLNTFYWCATDVQKYNDYILISVVVDNDSFKYISGYNFSLFAGVDVANFVVD